MKKLNKKYLDDETYKKDSFDALSSQFKDINEFEKFYRGLSSDDIKNDFLRVGTSYLFFVKSGDWHVNVERSNPVIDYITNSFKLISALSITESVTKKSHIDFFQWLNKKKNRHLFPIENEVLLKQHYELYKKEYGSIYAVKDFFNNLSQVTKDSLCRRVTVNGEPITDIEELIKLIYEARSKFTHSTDSILEFSGDFHTGGTKKKRIVFKEFKISYLLAAIEEGIVTHFKKI